MAFWNGPGNVITSFGGLRNGKDFTDVTLVSGDCKKVETHKRVLSISSSVFQNILKGNRRAHPMTFLRRGEAAVCGKEAKNQHIKNHIDANDLEGLSHPCYFFEKTFRSRAARKLHMQCHRQSKN